MIQIDQDIVQRELLYAGGVVLALGLFLYVRSALLQNSDARSRSSSQRTLDAEEAASLEPFFPAGADWFGKDSGRHALPAELARSPVWDVTLFEITRREPLQALQLEGARWFSLGKTPRDTERIVSPLVRKLIARFRADFERSEPVTYVKAYAREAVVGAKPLVSWMGSERHIHQMCHWFLAEMRKMAREAGVVPRLEIRFDEGLSLNVRMPYARELAALQALSQGNPHVSVAITRETISIELWLAFSQNSLPGELFRDTIAESSRDKRRAS